MVAAFSLSLFLKSLLSLCTALHCTPQPRDNVERAIGLATEKFKIAPLVDVDDVVTAKADEKCIMTYVSEFAFMFELMGRTKQQDVLSEREQARSVATPSLLRFVCLFVFSLKESGRSFFGLLSLNDLKPSNQRANCRTRTAVVAWCCFRVEVVQFLPLILLLVWW
jgi:hypothetical protein